MARKSPQSSAALVALASPTREIPAISLAFDPLALVADEQAARANLGSLAEVSILSQADADFIASVLVETVKKEDAVKAVCDGVTGQLDACVKTIKGWFKPTLADLRQLSDELRRKLGAWNLAIERERQAALALAAQAAVRHDTPALTQALTVANAMPAKLDGVGIRFVWRAKIVNEGMLTREWLTPDVAKINAHARGTAADAEPFPIPGVIFERDTESRVSHQ